MNANADFPIHRHRLRDWLSGHELGFFAFGFIKAYGKPCCMFLSLAAPCISLSMSLPAYLRTNLLFPLAIVTILGCAAVLVFDSVRPRRLSGSVRQSMQEMVLASPRLVVLDRGLIGMASPYTEVGDKICFLAGCKDAAVLRPGVCSGVTQYQVVGQASVCLSRSDKRKYRAFAERRLVQHGKRYDEFYDSLEYARLMKEYQREDWWQDFLLV